MIKGYVKRVRRAEERSDISPKETLQEHQDGHASEMSGSPSDPPSMCKSAATTCPETTPCAVDRRDDIPCDFLT